MAKINIEVSNGVAVVRFNNPPHGIFDFDMFPVLQQSIERLADDPETRVLVFTGQSPGIFIERADLGAIEHMIDRARSHDGPLPEEEAAIAEVHRMLRRLEALPKPVIAAINGSCIGFGLEFAMACDIRIAELGPYWLGLPEVNLGLLGAGGGTQRLPRLLGEARALEFAMEGTTIGPQEAERLGLVHYAVPAALETAMVHATRLASQPKAALAGAKRLVRAAAGLAMEDGNRLETAVFMPLLRDDETRERVREVLSGRRSVRD